MALPAAENVIVKFSATRYAEDLQYPQRELLFDAKKPNLPIGRSSRRSLDLAPRLNNGYFNNHVMSREHAQIFVDLFFRRVFLKDLGSLHGTFINDMKAIPQEATIIKDNDTIVFGASVGRGNGVYHPCTFKVSIEFAREDTSPRTFRVPDDSEDESVMEFQNEIKHPVAILEKNGVSVLQPAAGETRAVVHDQIDLTSDTSSPPSPVEMASSPTSRYGSCFDSESDGGEPDECSDPHDDCFDDEEIEEIEEIDDDDEYCDDHTEATEPDVTLQGRPHSRCSDEPTDTGRDAAFHHLDGLYEGTGHSWKAAVAAAQEHQQSTGLSVENNSRPTPKFISPSSLTLIGGDESTVVFAPSTYCPPLPNLRQNDLRLYTSSVAVEEVEFQVDSAYSNQCAVSEQASDMVPATSHVPEEPVSVDDSDLPDAPPSRGEPPQPNAPSEPEPMDHQAPPCSTKRKASEISGSSETTVSVPVPAEPVIPEPAVIVLGEDVSVKCMPKPNEAVITELQSQDTHSIDEEVEDVPAAPQVDKVKGEPSPKRLRAMAQAVGYAALGGAATGIAILSTLIATGPNLA